ncbi:MAG: alpha-L-fucosidase [Bacteroidales bacterium]|nr:alpha-L-fucosidase [Bacteroidales bacterium]
MSDEYKPYIYAQPEDLVWFKDAKFGVFIHWGPSSIAEVPIGWGRFGPRPGAGKQATNGVPKEKYDSLYTIFNPVKFNADEWINMINKSGAKYLIFTTKHHDGFCMFDAHNTDYKITNTPFGRDIAKELADACHAQGIKLFWYYSQPDWHHPDCLTENNDRYRDYMYEHLHQLLTEYGKIDGIFFDHLGTKSKDWDTPRLLKMIRTLQPDIIINKRWGGNMPDINVNGDYDTPEQEIGHFQIDRPWETCATMATAWSWTGGEKVKSYQTNLRLLLQCAGAGGNLALNTGPRPDGSIFAPEYQNYISIGKWLANNGESIYGTTGGPYKPGPWGVSTRKENKIYLHILTDFANNSKREFELADPGFKIIDSRSLEGNPIFFSQENGVLRIKLIDSGSFSPDNILELTIEGDALQIEPIKTLPIEIIEGKKGFASSFSQEHRSAEAVFGGDAESFAEGKKHKIWWEPKNGDKDLYMGFEFPKDVSFTWLTLSEQIRNASIREFELQYWDDDQWISFFHGCEIGFDFSLKTDRITTRKVRIVVLKTQENSNPNISSFKIY